MKPRQLRWLLVIGWSLAGATMPVITAQTTQPAQPVAGKRCNAMHAKVAREEKARKATADAIAKDQRARANCSSKSMCARYDGSIQAMEKRQMQQQARVARFEADAAAACRPS